MYHGIHRTYKQGERRLQLVLCSSAEDETGGLDLGKRRETKALRLFYLLSLPNCFSDRHAWCDIANDCQNLGLGLQNDWERRLEEKI